MILKSLFLQNFRNYKKAQFEFESKISVVIGVNASGKSNLLEGIYALSSGGAGSDSQMVSFGEDFCRVMGVIEASDENTDFEGELELVLTKVNGVFRKKYLVNKIAKRRADFAGRLLCVRFCPDDLGMVSGQPGQRRRFLDEILTQTDYEYRVAMGIYAKALRQRNSLLERVKKTGVNKREAFLYWDSLLIRHGAVITEGRERLIEDLNRHEKKLFPFVLEYDKSTITEERLEKYAQAEVGAGVTLIGPQRDEVKIMSFAGRADDLEEVKYFFSRGQQRLVVLGLKLLQVEYIFSKRGSRPLLLLDDIFSELDDDNIGHVLEVLGGSQVILTTTHEDFVPEKLREGSSCVRLGKF